VVEPFRAIACKGVVVSKGRLKMLFANGGTSFFTFPRQRVVAEAGIFKAGALSVICTFLLSCEIKLIIREA
jgi:hypothetical protein